MTNKHKFLREIILGLSLVCSSGSFADDVSGQSAEQGASRFQDAVMTTEATPNGTKMLRDATADAEVLLIGETVHDHIENVLFATSPAAMQSLADAGVAELLIEIPMELQSFADEFASGKMERPDFLHFMDAWLDLYSQNEELGAQKFKWLADSIENGKASGVKIVFIDSGEDIELTSVLNEEEKAIVEAFWNKFVAYREGGGSRDAHGFARKTLSDADQKVIIDLGERMLTFRLNDTDLAARVSARVDANLAQGKKTAVLFGNDHLNRYHTVGLDELLTGKGHSLAVVELHKNRAAYQSYQRYRTQTQSLDTPDFSYLIAEDRVLRPAAQASRRINLTP